MSQSNYPLHLSLMAGPRVRAKQPFSHSALTEISEGSPSAKLPSSRVVYYILIKTDAEHKLLWEIWNDKEERPCCCKIVLGPQRH